MRIRFSTAHHMRVLKIKYFYANFADEKRCELQCTFILYVYMCIAVCTSEGVLLLSKDCIMPNNLNDSSIVQDM